jgi:translation initiation factor IF-3
LLIDEENNQVGVITAREAMDRAEEVGLDLVEVSPNAKPPVCKIMDYGKYQYEKNKRAREARKKQTKIVLKEIQFRPDTAEHDYQFKKRHVEDFLKNGWKVRATVRFRGREMLHTELGRKMLTRLEEDVAELAEIEQPAKMETRVMSMLLTPKSS